MLMKELNSFFKFSQKNKSFFNTCGETITVSANFSQLVTEVSRQVCILKFFIFYFFTEDMKKVTF